MALQTQMNPHFVFNALNAIQLFLTNNDEENAMNYLAKFARLIRLAFEYTKESYISLDQEIEFLNLYLTLESLRFSNSVDIKMELDEFVRDNESEFKIPPLLIQPVIENAFKHGLFHKKQNKKLEIKFESIDGLLKCTITDNGVGRKKAAQINNWKNSSHKSSGLKNTRTRLKLLHNGSNNSKNKITTFNITDLYDENENPSGTKVEIYLTFDPVTTSND